MKRFLSYWFICLVFFACNAEDPGVSTSVPNPNPANPTNPDPDPTNPDPVDTIPNTATPIRYLALGDSYTIGQNVCEDCRFPAQLKSQLQTHFPDRNVELQLIATTGWTTTNLISAIQNQNPSHDKDLVTLLIGVNNQYQHKPFSLFDTEFPQLVNTAISLANGDKNNLIVVSIPDYAYTPYGQNSDFGTITSELAQYNAFIESYCASQEIAFVNITDITQMGLENPGLVASDGLHPSAAAYAQFVQRILPKAIATLP